MGKNKFFNFKTTMENKVKTLFSGLNTVDLQFFVNSTPKLNTKTKASRNEVAVGGPATNASIACAFLGSEATLITPIGNHSLAEFVKDDILKYGIKIIDPIENIESKPVFASIITNEMNGERTIFSNHPDKCGDEIFRELGVFSNGTFNIAMFDGFHLKLNIPLAKYLKSQGITTVLDGGSWKSCMEDILPFIDIAICSNDFIPPGTKSKLDVIKFLLDFGIKKIAITRGEKPILIYEHNQKKELSVPKIKAIDTLGAGDFFHGAFCFYYAFQPNFEQALKNAASIASISCQYHGTRSWMKNFKNLTVNEL